MVLYLAQPSGLPSVPAWALHSESLLAPAWAQLSWELVERRGRVG